MKKGKVVHTEKTGRYHDGYCQEMIWGSDNRFTCCLMCAQMRFYENGYDGTPHERKTSVPKKPERLA